VVLGLIFIYFTLPETKGKKLEEVEALFNRPWCSGSNYDQLDSSNETNISAQ